MKNLLRVFPTNRRSRPTISQLEGKQIHDFLKGKRKLSHRTLTRKIQRWQRWCCQGLCKCSPHWFPIGTSPAASRLMNGPENNVPWRTLKLTKQQPRKRVENYSIIPACLYVTWRGLFRLHRMLCKFAHVWLYFPLPTSLVWQTTDISAEAQDQICVSPHLSGQRVGSWDPGSAQCTQCTTNEHFAVKSMEKWQLMGDMTTSANACSLEWFWICQAQKYQNLL